MTALKYDPADVAISQSRIAKILGREPTKMTIRKSDAFGDFEYVTCCACEGTGRIGRGVTRECPVCSSDDLARSWRRQLQLARWAIEEYRDAGDEWARDAAALRFVEAREAMRLVRAAMARGAS